MDESVVARGDEPPFEARSPNCFRRVLRVLLNLHDVSSVEIVLSPKPTLELEAFPSRLSGMVDAPLLRGGELSYELVLCEELDDLFAYGSCGEGPD